MAVVASAVVRPWIRIEALVPVDSTGSEVHNRAQSCRKKSNQQDSIGMNSYLGRRCRENLLWFDSAISRVSCPARNFQRMRKRFDEQRRQERIVANAGDAGFKKETKIKWISRLLAAKKLLINPLVAACRVEEADARLINTSVNFSVRHQFLMQVSQIPARSPP
jgi:hypothetical protein